MIRAVWVATRRPCRRSAFDDRVGLSGW